MNYSIQNRDCRTPSNSSATDIDHQITFANPFKTPRNKSQQVDIFMKKIDLVHLNKYKSRPKKYFSKYSTEFSNTFIKSKVLDTKNQYKEIVQYKLLGKLQTNPENIDYISKTAKVLSRPKADICFSKKGNLIISQPNSRKREYQNHFKYLIKQSQKILNLSQQKSRFYTPRPSTSRIKGKQSYLLNRSFSPSKRRQNSSLVHKSSFNFQQIQEPNEKKPKTLTFGKYKTIHQRSKSQHSVNVTRQNRHFL